MFTLKRSPNAVLLNTGPNSSSYVHHVTVLDEFSTAWLKNLTAHFVHTRSFNIHVQKEICTAEDLNFYAVKVVPC